MKRLALFAAVLAVAACSTAEKPADTMRSDTAAPAMAPAPTDGAMMRDSMMRDSMMRDSMMKDSMMHKGMKGMKGMKKTP